MLNLFKKIEVDGKNGSVLIFALLILAVMLFLSSYFISFGLTGSRMSSSQAKATKAYHLAEAGIQEAIFKLKNDPAWKNAFETQPTIDDPDCSSWSIPNYQRSPALFDRGSYEINIDNLGCAKARITSTSTIIFKNKKIAQRVVKTEVYKAIGNPISDFSIFTGGGSSENIRINSTNPLNIHNGSIFSNNKIDLNFESVVNVDNKALAHNKITISDGSWFWSPSQLNASGTCASNICQGNCSSTIECPPDQILISSPGFNFYRQAAKNNNFCSSLRTDGKTNCFFASKEEFERLMWKNYPEITLDGVIYVDGDVNIRAGQKLTVNGTLVSGQNKDINIGEENCWFRSEWPFLYCGSSEVVVNRPGVDEPSGILAQRKINIGGWLGIGTKALYVEGLIYSGGEMRLSSIGAPIEIHGGIAAGKFTLSSLWKGVDIYLDSDVIIDTFGDPEYSPVISINHWEEEY